jgi:hypothetical protein
MRQTWGQLLSNVIDYITITLHLICVSFILLIQLDLTYIFILSQRYHFQVQKITCMQLEIISLM